MLNLSREDGRDVIYGDHADWETVNGTGKIIDQRRWSTIREAIFFHVLTDKHYRICWSEGSTEMQESTPFEFNDPEPVEVELRDVTVSKWVEVKS